MDFGNADIRPTYSFKVMSELLDENVSIGCEVMDVRKYECTLKVIMFIGC